MVLLSCSDTSDRCKWPLALTLTFVVVMGATVVILLLIRRGNSAGETDNGVVVVVAVAFGDCTEGIGLPKLAWCEPPKHSINQFDFVIILHQIMMILPLVELGIWVNQSNSQRRMDSLNRL